MEILQRQSIDWSEGSPAQLGDSEASDELPTKPDGAVRLGHLSDFHLGKPLEDATVPAVVGEWLADFDAAGVDVIVFGGDLVEVPDARVPLLRMRHMLDESGIPWVCVPGNHDVQRPGEGPFYELFGEYPRVERHAGIDFVLLDTMAGLPARERGPFERLSFLKKGYFSRGRVGAEQLRTAASRLNTAEQRPRVLVLHHHLAPQEQILDELPVSSAPSELMVTCLDAPEVSRWAADLGLRLVFHGHMHAFWPLYRPEERLVAVNSGSSTRGKPERRARIVDLAPGGARTWVVGWQG